MTSAHAHHPARPAPARCAIALGANLGDRAATLRSALAALARAPGCALVASSDFLQTEPVGPIAQGPFLNAAALLDTTLTPRELLALLHEVERAHGRDRAREQRWGPRTLDLDLITYADLVLDEPGLTLPHPRVRERSFVLRPLAQIAPDLALPPDGLRVQHLLANLPAHPPTDPGPRDPTRR